MSWLRKYVLEKGNLLDSTILDKVVHGGENDLKLDVEVTNVMMTVGRHALAMYHADLACKVISLCDICEETTAPSTYLG